MTAFVAILSCGVAFTDPVSAWMTSAETFDGYVVGTGGTVSGTVQIKAAKPNEKTGTLKLTAAVTMLGEKKLSIKGETIDGTAIDAASVADSFAGGGRSQCRASARRSGSDAEEREVDAP